MKNSAWYNKLWQTKMQELPTQGDADLLWQKMQGLLDENMPVTHTGNNVKISKNWLFKLAVLLGTVAVAILIYYAISRSSATKNKPNKPVNNRHVVPFNNTKRDSLYNKTTTDTNGQTLPNTGSSITTTQKNSTNAANNTKPTTAVSNNGAGSSNSLAAIAGKKQSEGRQNAQGATTGNDGNLKSGNGNNKVNYRKRLHTNNTGGNAAQNNKSVKSLRKLNKRKNDANQRGRLAQRPGNNDGINNDADTSGSSNPTAPGQNNAVLSDAKNADSTGKASVQKDSTLAASSVSKQKADKLPSAKKQKAGSDKSKNDNKASISKFELGVKAGFNFGRYADANPYFGVFGSYYLTPKLAVGIGASVLQTTIKGGYSNSNYKYTAIIDTNKLVTRTADKLTVNSIKKMYNVDVPILISYRVFNHVTIIGGPVIGIPLHTMSVKSTLAPISNPADTAKVYKTITTAAAGTTISSKLNFSLQGGININLSRFFIEGSYLQGLSPYTISSALGNGKSYYHSYQLGIGYVLFKSKSKPKSKQ